MTATHAELRRELADLGCSNHGCDVVKRIGMGTNGPCHCLDVGSPAERRRLRGTLRMLRDLADDPSRDDLRLELQSRSCGADCCVAKPRGGMSTNGGCACFDGLDVRQRRRVIHAVGIYRQLAAGEPKG